MPAECSTHARRNSGPAQQGGRGDDRGQRVAQLVREQGEELVLGAVGRLRLGARGLLSREELHVAHRQGRLVGEGLEQVDVGLRERTDLRVSRGDRADDLALDLQRHRQHRVVARARQTPPELRGEDDARLVEDIARPERPLLDDGASHEANAGRQDVAGLEVLQPLARDGHTRERAIGEQQADHRGLRLKQGQDALGDPLRHLVDVERLGEPPGHARQLIGVSPELLAFRLGPLEIGDVGDVGHEAAHPAVLPHVGHVGGAHVAWLAVTIGQLTLEGDETAGERGPHVRCDGRVRHVTDDLADGAADELLHGTPEPVLVGEVVEAVAFVRVDVADQGRHRLDDELESACGCASWNRG